MADIVFKYDEMQTAVANIRETGAAYKKAAETFDTDFTAAITSWEGESKNKMQSFYCNNLKICIEEQIPQLVEALAGMLEENAKYMQDADKRIADNISE